MLNSFQHLAIFFSHSQRLVLAQAGIQFVQKTLFFSFPAPCPRAGGDPVCPKDSFFLIPKLRFGNAIYIFQT
jgi:hypothetical protein